MRKKLLTQVYEFGDHPCAFGRVIQERTESGGNVSRGELVLNEFRDDATAGDEIDHGDR